MEWTPIIQVDKLTKRYGRLLAVNSVSFSVHKSEVFGILGPNGAGKTTTIEIMEGMRAPDSGTAMVSGIDVIRHPQRVKAIIGVQLQTSAFFDGLNLTEILQVFGSLYRANTRAHALLESVELSD
ncbi:MAG: ATP-binding cassette domain-containing protein, partial [Dehalococcoidia bacterium]